VIPKKRNGQTLKKVSCEVCSYPTVSALHIHHIIPRQDPRSSNNLNNLAVLCATCHSLVHSGDIIIIGVYSSSAGRKLMWFRKGEPPPLEESLWKIHPKDNPLVILRKNQA